MVRFRLPVILVAAGLTLFLIAGQSPAQEGSGQGGDEETVIELLPPNYTNADYGFGMVLPADYTPAPLEEGDVWVLEIFPQYPDLANARLSVENLPDDVTDVAGFWQLLKDRDPAMEQNATYEMVTSVADTGAIQTRIESLGGGGYILVILWIWVHDGHGYTLSGYPPEGGGNADLARDIAGALVEQFRWMTPEEIEAAQAAPPPPGPEPSIGPGTEF
jgi:hypothetical protein